VEKNSGLNHFFKTRIVSIHTVPQNALILPLWNPTVDANSAWLGIAGSTVGFPADDTPPEIKMILTYSGRKKYGASGVKTTYIG
jgi:hypothetical protein